VVSFDVSNRVGAQPQIKYAVQLTQVLAKSELQVDEKVYDETLSLGENTTVSRTVNYSIPASLSAGTYRLWIDSKNNNGLPFGIAFAGEVNITENALNAIEIVPDSCYLVTSTSTQATQTPLSQGIVISPADTLMAKCKVTSNFSADTIFTPSFVTRSHTLFGEVVSTTGNSTENITIKNGNNDITLALPKASKPQDYNLTFSLVSSLGNTVSNAISFNYAISGQSGIIRNVVFDKTFYKAGETANLQIFSTRTGLFTQTGTSTITILVSNSAGADCSVALNKEVSNFSVINLSIPITKDCADPKASVTLSSNGVALDSKDFQFITPMSASTSIGANTNKIIIALVLIVFVLILGTLIYNYFHKKK
jgi:hypothetical protein